MVYLTRKAEFAASHYYHNPAFTPEQNRATFGKCNNPYGHGHNYTVQVTVSGQVDPMTGMVCDLADLDGFARKNVVERFDHTNLNTLDCFENRVSTTENLSIEIYRIFKDFTAAHVERIHVEETSNNSFDYAGDEAPAPGTI